MNRKEFIATLIIAIKQDKPLQCVIHTNRICERCAYHVSRNIFFEKGVKDVEIDIAQKKIIINYDTRKTSIEKLKNYIVSLGFDADNLRANIYRREIVRDCCLTDISICK